MIQTIDASSQNAQSPLPPKEETPDKTPLVISEKEEKEKANDSASSETDEPSDIEEDARGTCCFCGHECNPCSQACGSCARSATMDALGWRSYV